MQLPRFIPRPVFQAIALGLLTICLTSTSYCIANDSGLYRAFQNLFNHEEMAMLATALVMILGLLVIIAPIRMFSTMPTLREELGVGMSDGLPAMLKSFNRLVATEAARYRIHTRVQDRTDRMKRRMQQLGMVFVVVGVLLSAAGLLMLAVSGEMWAMLIEGPVLIVVGFIQIVTGKPMLRK